MDTNNSSNNDNNIVEMNNYMNYADEPHTVTITDKKTNKVVLRKKCETETHALNYLNEARGFGNNSQKFRFNITGPNMFYSV